MHFFTHTCHDMQHYRHTTTHAKPSRILAMGSPFCPAATLPPIGSAHIIFCVLIISVLQRKCKKNLSLSCIYKKKAVPLHRNF